MVNQVAEEKQKIRLLRNKLKIRLLKIENQVAEKQAENIKIKETYQ